MQGFDVYELLIKFRYPILILIIGVILIGGGFFFIKTGFNNSTNIEVLGESSINSNVKTITAEIAGEVIKPGVYKLSDGSRVEDLLLNAGGFSDKVDTEWTDKYLNRASRITDGQKVYIPGVNKQSSSSTANVKGDDQTVSSANLTDSSRLININTSSLSELDKLPGIGQTYAQNIIEHRPYSNVEELVSKGAIKQSLFNKIKNLVTVY